MQLGRSSNIARLKDLTVSKGLQVKNLQHYSSENVTDCTEHKSSKETEICCSSWMQPVLFRWCFMVVREGQCEMLHGNVFGGHSESLHMNPDP